MQIQHAPTPPPEDIQSRIARHLQTIARHHLKLIFLQNQSWWAAQPEGARNASGKLVDPVGSKRWELANAAIVEVANALSLVCGDAGDQLKDQDQATLSRELDALCSWLTVNVCGRVQNGEPVLDLSPLINFAARLEQLITVLSSPPARRGKRPKAKTPRPVTEPVSAVLITTTPEAPSPEQARAALRSSVRKVVGRIEAGLRDLRWIEEWKAREGHRQAGFACFAPFPLSQVTPESAGPSWVSVMLVDTRLIGLWFESGKDLRTAQWSLTQGGPSPLGDAEGRQLGADLRLTKDALDEILTRISKWGSIAQQVDELERLGKALRRWWTMLDEPVLEGPVVPRQTTIAAQTDSGTQLGKEAKTKKLLDHFPDASNDLIEALTGASRGVASKIRKKEGISKKKPTRERADVATLGRLGALGQSLADESD